jgi:hypothetical protein
LTTFQRIDIFSGLKQREEAQALRKALRYIVMVQQDESKASTSKAQKATTRKTQKEETA